MREETWALVAFRSLRDGKSRLERIVRTPLRQQLMASMLIDVVSTLVGCPMVHRTIVCTKDQEVSSIAESLGAGVWLDNPCADYRSSISDAIFRAGAEGAARLLVVPGDVPTITISEVERFLAGSRIDSCAVAIAPSSDGLGTNGLAMWSKKTIPILFGPMSCCAHAEAARQAGVSATLLGSQGFELDVDLPRDIDRLANSRHACRSRAVALRIVGGKDWPRELALGENA